MKTIIIIGTLIVHLALIFYSIGIITEQRIKRVTKNVLIFVTLGVIFDIVATLCMIMGSTRGLITLHGLVGYSGLFLMLSDSIWLWKHFLKYGSSVQVSNALHLYSRITYIWWLLAYITGALLAYMRH